MRYLSILSLAHKPTLIAHQESYPEPTSRFNELPTFIVIGNIYLQRTLRCSGIKHTYHKRILLQQFLDPLINLGNAIILK